MKLKGFQTETAVGRAFVLLLLLFCIHPMGMNAQTNPPPAAPTGCGVFKKLPGTEMGYKGQIYYDRFGNSWTSGEISHLAANILDECSAGVFKLSFSGDYTSNERDQVCAALTSLSGTVSGGAPGGIVPLKIEFISNVDGGGAAASQFMLAECGLMKNMALVNIITHANKLPLGFFAGLIQIDSDPDWYTGATPTVSDWNTLLTGKVDLFTAVLHEGMHILGVASTFGGADVNGTVLSRFTTWDNYLYQQNGTSYVKLIQPANDPTCCSRQQVNPNAPTSFPGTCDVNIMFRDGPTDIAEVSYNGLNGTAVSDINNRLSHLDISCGSGAQYVMHPGLPPSPALYSYPRRMLTQAELDILCRIGYPAASSCVTCVVAAEDDTYPNVIFLTGSNANNPAYLPLGPFFTSFSLLGNDVIPNNPIVELCGHDAGINVELVGTDVKVTGLTPGNWTFCYRLRSTLPNCSSACDEATVHVTVLQAPIYTHCVNNDCNLLCFGSFELFPAGASYYSSLNAPEYYFHDLSTTEHNTPDICVEANVTPSNKVIRWARSTVAGQDQESIRLPLSQPIFAGCTTTVHLQITAAYLGALSAPTSTMRMEVYGLTAPPCAGQIPTHPSWGGEQSASSFCTGVTAYGMDQNTNLPFDVNAQTNQDIVSNLDLEGYTFIYTHPAGAPPITDLVVFGTFTPTIPEPIQHEGLEFYMDNVVVTSSCNTQINITPTIVSQCIGGQAVVTYSVCLLGSGGTAVPISLQAQIPVGLTVVAGGGFNASGLASFSLVPGASCNGGSNTITLTLTMNVSSSFDPNLAPIAVPLPLDLVGTNLCVDPSIGAGGDVTLQLQDCTVPVACHCSPNTGYEVGTNINSVTQLSMTNLPSTLQGTCLTVNGRLLVDKDFTISNTHVIMNRGAEIVVQYKKRLEVNKFSLLEGCAHMWRGITVEYGGTLVMTQGTNTMDAQWAVKALAGSTITVTDSYFDHDYVGIYVPPSASGAAQTVNVVAITGNQFSSWAPLKTAYSVPNNPNQQQVPQPGLYTYAGISLNNVTGFDIGTNNNFDEVRNGVFAVGSGFTIRNCKIRNLVADPADLNPEFNYNVDQHGVYADNCSLAKITNCLFLNNGKGVYSRATNITADSNTVTGFNYDSPGEDIGIDCILNTNKSVRIRHNTITTWGSGISINSASPASILRVKYNTVSLYANSTSPYIDLEAIRGGYVAFNTVTRTSATATGPGISMFHCGVVTVDGNHLLGGLVNGINTQSCGGNTFVRNEALGGGQLGYAVYSSADTYCSNRNENQSDDGFYFWGMCLKPNALRCNRIGSTSTSGISGLRLWSDGANNTKIGTQINGGNLWNGTYSQFAAYNEVASNTDIMASQFRLPSSQIPSWSTAIGQTAAWFTPVSVTPLNCLFACPLVVDTDEDQYPPTHDGEEEDGDITDEDIKSAQNGHYGVGFNWMARQRLYERLQRYPSIASQNTSVQQFFTDAATAELGKLYNVNTALVLLEGRDAYTWAAIGAVQKEIAQLSDELQGMRSAGPGQNYATWSLKLSLLQQQLQQATNRLLANEKWQSGRRLTEAPAIIAQNAGVTSSNICAVNQQTLNAIYLNNALWKDNPLTASTLLQLKAIADQCPLDGGFAVYEARCLYHRFVRTQTWNPAADCAKHRSRSSADHSGRPDLAFNLSPNPANEVLLVTPSADLDQTTAQLELFNLVGRSVATLKIESASGVSLSTGSLPAGVYFYKITGQGKLLQSGKILIAH